METKKTDEIRIFSTMGGEVRQIWVKLPGCPARNVADEFDQLSENQLVERAQKIEEQRCREKNAIAQAEREFPGYEISWASDRCRDLDLPDDCPEGAVIVLSKRKRHGKYQVVKFYNV